jgi:hypothetical protein
VPPNFITNGPIRRASPASSIAIIPACSAKQKQRGKRPLFPRLS